MPTTEAVPAVNSPSLPASSKIALQGHSYLAPEPATNIPKSAKVWSLAFFNVPGIQVFGYVSRILPRRLSPDKPQKN